MSSHDYVARPSGHLTADTCKGFATSPSWWTSCVDKHRVKSREHKQALFQNQIMSKIILLNGACWIGKSTIAKLLHQRIEFSFLREKDAQRRNISHYKDTKEHQRKSWDLILDLTKSLIESCIKNKIDVIMDGVLWEQHIIQDLESYIKWLWWFFFHIYLNAPKDVWEERLINRWISWSHRKERAEFFYDSLQKLKENVVMYEVDTEKFTPEEVLEKIVEVIN